MLTKSKVIASMNNLPEEFSIDDLVDRLILIAKVEEALEQVNSGETYSSKEVKKMMSNMDQLANARNVESHSGDFLNALNQDEHEALQKAIHSADQGHLIDHAEVMKRLKLK